MTKRRYDTDVTRRELLESARDEFANSGYQSASTEVIVGRFGLTRGALYHHFGNKRGLFESVVEDLQRKLAEEVVQRALDANGTALVSLRAGFTAYLDSALRLDVRQILMVDAPAVLGWERWREIDIQYAFGACRAAVKGAMAAGEIGDAPLDELTHVLLGAVTQAGLEIGRAPDPGPARARYGSVIDQLLDALSLPSSNPKI